MSALNCKILGNLPRSCPLTAADGTLGRWPNEDKPNMELPEPENEVHPTAELDTWENEGGCCHPVNHSEFPSINEAVLWE